MNKKEVQKRVLQNGKPLALNKFSWDEKTYAFSTNENNLVIDFSFISHCTFTTGSHCTFTTGSDCTFITSSDCTFKTAYNCVVVRRDIFESITLNNETITLCPFDIEGYIKDGIYSKTGKPAILADRILSEIQSKKVSGDTTIYKVVNHKETEISYLIQKNGIYSHGKTIKEAKESFKYKISNRDLSQFDNLTLNSVITQEEAIKLYRTITGACESGTRYFVEQLKNPPIKLSIKELIELTKGQYNHNLLVEFFKIKAKDH